MSLHTSTYQCDRCSADVTITDGVTSSARPCVDGHSSHAIDFNHAYSHADSDQQAQVLTDWS